jgi:hypothetical protein
LNKRVVPSKWYPSSSLKCFKSFANFGQAASDENDGATTRDSDGSPSPTKYFDCEEYHEELAKPKEKHVQDEDNETSPEMQLLLEDIAYNSSAQSPTRPVSKKRKDLSPEERDELEQQEAELDELEQMRDQLYSQLQRQDEEYATQMTKMEKLWGNRSKPTDRQVKAPKAPKAPKSMSSSASSDSMGKSGPPKPHRKGGRFQKRSGSRNMRMQVAFNAAHASGGKPYSAYSTSANSTSAFTFAPNQESIAPSVEVEHVETQ